MRHALMLLTAGTLLTTACGSDDPTTNCTVSAVTITGAPSIVVVAGTVSLAADVTQTNCTDSQVAWSTSNASLLSVSQTGLVTGLSAGGPVTITATSGGKSGTVQITVATRALTSVAVSPDSIVVGSGGTFLLTGVTRMADHAIVTDRPVVWATSSPVTATVANGLVTGFAPGATTITATSEGITATGKAFVVRPRLVYLWSNTLVPVAGLTAPDPDYRYSSLPGATYSIVPLGGTGVYSVGFNGFMRTGVETEVVFVSAYGTDSRDQQCTLFAWVVDGATVRCWGGSGDLTNLRFTLLAIGSATFGGRSAYAWSDEVSPDGARAVDPFYRYSSSNRPITVTKTADGVYLVRFVGQARTTASDREALMVSASGGINQCQPSAWTSQAADLVATVHCFSAFGAPVDTRFTIALVSEPRMGAALGYADADQPTSTASYTPVNSRVLPAGAVTVIRTGAGEYTVRFDGVIRSGALKESFQVSAVGTTPVRCAINSWASDATGASAVVHCGTSAGAAVDARFVIVAIQ